MNWSKVPTFVQRVESLNPLFEHFFLFCLNILIVKISLDIHAAQCNLGVLLCQEVKQQLLVWMATGQVVDYMILA
jgi:hypothetical protein